MLFRSRSPGWRGHCRICLFYNSSGSSFNPYLLTADTERFDHSAHSRSRESHLTGGLAFSTSDFRFSSHVPSSSRLPYSANSRNQNCLARGHFSFMSFIMTWISLSFSGRCLSLAGYAGSVYGSSGCHCSRIFRFLSHLTAATSTENRNNLQYI